MRSLSRKPPGTGSSFQRDLLQAKTTVTSVRVQSQHLDELTPALIQILHKHFPDLPDVPTGKPHTHDEIVKSTNVFVGAHATKVLGVKYESLEDTVVEMTKSLRQRYHF